MNCSMHMSFILTSWGFTCIVYYMYLWAGAYVWKPDISVESLLQSFFTLFLRQDLSLKLDLAWLASQGATGLSCFCLYSTGITDVRHCIWHLGFRECWMWILVLKYKHHTNRQSPSQDFLRTFCKSFVYNVNIFTLYSSELTQTKKSLCRAHTQRTMGSGNLRSLKSRFWVMARNKKVSRTESMKGMEIPTGTRKKLKAHSTASKINLCLHCSFANTFMVSDYHLPGSLDGGATSVVESKTSVSLSSHLIRVTISLLFLCLVFGGHMVLQSPVST